MSRACTTVEWSRPNAAAIAGSVWPLCSQARYIAIWRGPAIAAAAVLAQQLFDRELEVIGHGALDLGDRNLGRVVLGLDACGVRVE